MRKLQGTAIGYTEGQKKFLKERALKAKDNEVCCDCPGCDTCNGFVRNCVCDQDMESIRKVMRR